MDVVPCMADGGKKERKNGKHWERDSLKKKKKQVFVNISQARLAKSKKGIAPLWWRPEVQCRLTH